MVSRTTGKLCWATLACVASPISGRVWAADHDYVVPAGDLGVALATFARQSGGRIIVPADLVAGRQTPGVSGLLSESAALDALLAGSGLHAELIAGAYVVRPNRAPTSSASQAADEILVTGTRIRGSAPIGAPLTVIDRRAIEGSGRATVADYIQTLPQNFAGGPNEASVGNNPRNGANVNQSYGSSINLRGLGTSSTLVLFDGNRPALGGYDGSFADVSLIPSTAIDRIEVLTDGASAIYGTDAVAGVVNVRFRNRLEGFDTRIYNATAGGAFTQTQLGQAGGMRWNGGGIIVAYQYDHRGRLEGNDRRASTEDLRPFGGPDLRSIYTSPGNIVAADGSGFAVPAGQDGRNLATNMLLPGITNRADRRRNIDLLPSQTVHSAYIAGDQSLGHGITATVRALYAHRAFSAVNPVIQLQPVTVPTSNPFYVDPIGTGEPVDVDYDFQPEVGRYRQTGTVSAFTGSAGLEGQLGRWRIEAQGSYGRQVEKDLDHNAISDARVSLALADTDPTTALNVFGGGTGNNPATIDFIRAIRYQYTRYRVWAASLRLDGPLFSLPAGTVKLATGYEHRDEKLDGLFTYNTATDTPDQTDTYVTAGTPGTRSIDAVYAELSVPVLGPSPDRLPGRLDLSLAARSDWYSDVGRTVNPKVGVRWEPVKGLALRGSYGTSFRAPGFTENPGTSQNLYEPIALDDPRSPTGQTAVLAEVGYAAAIKPEKATSWTAGFDLKTDTVKGLTVSASYFDIAYRDRIGSANPDYAMFLIRRDIYGGLIQEPADPARVAARYADPLFSNPFGIAASDIQAIIDLEIRNLSKQTVRGIDFDVRYTHPALGGTATAGIAGTRLIAIDEQLTSRAPADHIVGTFYNPVKLRFRGQIGWAKGGFDADAFINYVDGYRNQQVIPNEHVASWTTLDGQLGYRFGNATPLRGARLAVSATNLLNRRPPYVLNTAFDQTLAYDPGQASAVGRLISVQASLDW